MVRIHDTAHGLAEVCLAAVNAEPPPPTHTHTHLPPSLCNVSLMCEAAPRCCPSITLSLVISLLNWPVLVISSKLRTSKPVFNEEGKKEQSRGVEGVTCDIGSSPGAFRVITCTSAHTHTHSRKDWAEERKRHCALSMQRHPCKTFTHTHKRTQHSDT